MSSPRADPSSRFDARVEPEPCVRAPAGHSAMNTLSSPEPPAPPARRAQHTLPPALPGGVASARGELRARRPSSRGLWPGEATLLAVAVLWVLVLLYVGIGEWRRMVNDSRSDVGAYGDN